MCSDEACFNEVAVNYRNLNGMSDWMTEKNISFCVTEGSL